MVCAIAKEHWAYGSTSYRASLLFGGRGHLIPQAAPYEHNPEKWPGEGVRTLLTFLAHPVRTCRHHHGGSPFPTRSRASLRGPGPGSSSTEWGRPFLCPSCLGHGLAVWDRRIGHSGSETLEPAPSVLRDQRRWWQRSRRAEGRFTTSTGDGETRVPGYGWDETREMLRVSVRTPGGGVTSDTTPSPTDLRPPWWRSRLSHAVWLRDGGLNVSFPELLVVPLWCGSEPDSPAGTQKGVCQT